MKDKKGPLADMLIEVHAPAHISQEHSTKVAMKSKKHSIFTHFPKVRNYDVCMRTKINESLLQKTLAKLYREQKSVVT